MPDDENNIRKNLENCIHKRKASLTSQEAVFLNALLFDTSNNDQQQKVSTTSSPIVSDNNHNMEKRKRRMEKAVEVLSKDHLFQLPFQQEKTEEKKEEKERKKENGSRSSGTRPPLSPKKVKLRPQHIHVGLWKAHADCVMPHQLIKKSKELQSSSTSSLSIHEEDMQKKDKGRRKSTSAADATTKSDNSDNSINGNEIMEKFSNGCIINDKATSDNEQPSTLDEAETNKQTVDVAYRSKDDIDYGDNDDDDEDIDDDDDIRSDVEVRVEHAHKSDSYGYSDKSSNKNNIGDDVTDTSSWGMDECAGEHYDAWEVLKDEYAEDFGFNYTTMSTRTSITNPTDSFKIIGTSVDDKSAQPHVLSPPLMESLLSFVPDLITNSNYWLKFSLVRDGASLMTLKQYVRASEHTILAIETTKGDVFGCYTSCPWHTNLGYFGKGNCFVWKMRNNRMTPCHSLFEQAQMETEVDVYMYSNLNRYIQLCTSRMICIGGGKLDSSGNEDHGDLDQFPSPASDVVGMLRDDSDDIIGRGESTSKSNVGFGFAIALGDDLLEGTTSPCATFRSPCLTNPSSETGEVFQVMNMEVWTFTPCATQSAAEKLEMSQFFISESIHSKASSSRRSSGTSDLFPSSRCQDFNPTDFYKRVGENDESVI